MKQLTSMLIAMVLAFVLTAGAAQAQDTDTDVVDAPTVQTDGDADDEGGFDDWGLLGLLGLLGLAGLRRQPDRVVTREERRADRIDDVRSDVR